MIVSKSYISFLCVIISTQQRFTVESSRWTLLQTESENNVESTRCSWFLYAVLLSFLLPFKVRPQIVSPIRNSYKKTNSAAKFHWRKTINVLYSKVRICCREIFLSYQTRRRKRLSHVPCLGFWHFELCSLTISPEIFILIGHGLR